MKKFWIAMLAAMLLVLLPVASLAAVWVAGVQMEEGKYLPTGETALVAEKPASGGYALLKKENGQSVLTLHDYDNEGIVVDVLGEAWWSALAAKNEPLLLRLEGSNKLTADPYGYTEAISLMDADLTIAGTDSLEIKANYGIYDWDSSSVTINGGTVNVTTIDSGIHAENNLTINGGTVNVTTIDSGIFG